MANSASTQIHQLISTMSRSEKRYFKIHVRTHNSKHTAHYIELFKRIDSQDLYDEEQLVLDMEKRGSTQRFAVLKHRLFDKILDALEAYQRSSDKELELRHELNRARVMLDRGLEKTALDQLEKIALIAYQEEYPSLLLDAQYMIAELDVDRAERNPNMPTSKLLEELRAEWSIRGQEYLVRQQIRTEGRERAAQSCSLHTEPKELIKYLGEEHGPRLRFRAAKYLSAIYFSRSEFEKSEHYTRFCLQLIDMHPALEQRFYGCRTRLLGNQSCCLARLHKAEEARAAVKRLLMLSVSMESETEYLGILLQSLLFYLNRYEDNIMESRLVERLQIYKTLRWDMQPMIRAGIDFASGVFHHRKGDSSLALRCLNRILNDGEVSRNEDIYHRTLVLVTFIHAESGDREWMVHSARSLKRYLRARGLMGGLEQVLLDYIADYRRARSEEGEEKALRNFISRLRDIRKEPSERIAFEHFDFLSWAEARIKANYPDDGLVA